MANGESTIVKDTKQPDLSINQHPVASRTRRSSGAGNNSAHNESNSRAKNLIIPKTEQASRVSAQQQQDEPRMKRPRVHHRRDYNELVNGRHHSINMIMKRVARAHEKDEHKRSEEDIQLLHDQAHLLPSAIIYLQRKHEKQLLKVRSIEMEESCEMIKKKSFQLAELIHNSRHVVVYTGAGISTSASIPDYRGPNGLWTRIGRTGSFPMTRVFKDLAKTEPTLTHMAIGELCRRRIVKHVVSQNFDGLHLRSGIPQMQLSEIHGNMFIEICPSCERQYFRQADVTQKTVRFRHKTGRHCHDCSAPNNNLYDTIVLYGERSRSTWPMNWERADRAASNADLIICMGTSLKTLRRYSCLWPKSITTTTTSSSTKKRHSSSSSVKHETNLVIVNLQHTSKDKNAVLKISGKCDLVMEYVMERLSIDVPKYELKSDPLQRLATPFTPNELIKLERDLIFDNSKSFTKNTSGCDSNGPNIKVEVDEEHEAKVDDFGEAATLGQNKEENVDVMVQLASSAALCSDKEQDQIGRAQKRPSLEAASGASCGLEAVVVDDRCSPSLFVSETITDDPDKRRLRMRIRALTPSEV